MLINGVTMSKGILTLLILRSLNKKQQHKKTPYSTTLNPLTKKLSGTTPKYGPNDNYDHKNTAKTMYLMIIKVTETL